MSSSLSTTSFMSHKFGHDVSSFSLNKIMIMGHSLSNEEGKEILGYNRPTGWVALFTACKSDILLFLDVFLYIINVNKFHRLLGS